MDIIELAMLKGAELGIEAYATLLKGVSPNKASALMQTSDEHRLSQELLDRVLQYAVNKQKEETERHSK